MKKILFTISIILFFIIIGLIILTVPQKLQTQTIFSNNFERLGLRNQNRIGGASWSDFDNDDDLDLLLVGSTNRLYQNNGHGSFTDISQIAGVSVQKSTTLAGIFGDFDNDGCVDIYLSSQDQDRLLHNNCHGGFKDIASSSGLIQENFVGQGAAWADYDKDGYLDLYVANVGRKENDIYFSQPNFLYHNNGNRTFTNVIEKSQTTGITNCHNRNQRNSIKTNGTLKLSYQPIWLDYDQDNWPDLFIATDGGISPLYRNNRDGTFTEVTQEAGLCKNGTGMGANAADFDNDLDLDIYVTNYGANYLWQNNGAGTFIEIAATAGVADHSSVGWGTNFLDYDNDGDLDLYVANGTAQPNQDKPEEQFEKVMTDKLYQNLANGRFTEISAKSGIYGNFPKEASAIGDFDNNGFSDIFVNHSIRFEKTEEHRLYQNLGNGNKWLTVQLTGTKSNYDAVGAKITIQANGKIQTREIISGSSFRSQNSLWQTFGLGKAKIVESVKIKWPSGQEDTIENVKVNQKITFIEK